MSLSIRTKLFIAIFLAFLLAVGGMTLLIQLQVKNNLLRYVNEQEVAALSRLESGLLDYYGEAGSWDALRDNPRLWRQLTRGLLRSSLLPLNHDQQEGLPLPRVDWPDASRGMQPPPRLTRYNSRIVLLDADRQLVRGSTRRSPPDNVRPLKLDGVTVGYLGLHYRSSLTEKVDLAFAKRLQLNLWGLGLTVLLVAAFLSFLLARHLGRPIQALRAGTRQLTDGNYSLRMPVQGRDELALLTRDFNKLAERLQHNESSRKQWIADIAHELRTPLSVLRGEVEALQDGINQANARTFDSLHQEVSHLQRLVDDLYELSMSDIGALSYQLAKVDVTALLRETLSAHSARLHDQQLQIDTLDIMPEAVLVHGDQQRLQQLFANLLGNSLRYTDKPGQLRVASDIQGNQLHIVFEDSAPGVPDEALPHLFERLFRVDASRNRATGGAGIGLSICHNIVEAHEGRIYAAHSGLGGLAVHIMLPLNHQG